MYLFGYQGINSIHLSKQLGNALVMMVIVIANIYGALTYQALLKTFYMFN